MYMYIYNNNNTNKIKSHIKKIDENYEFFGLI